MVVLVCGGRDYHDAERVYMMLDGIHKSGPITTIVHGAARGADALADAWALSRSVACRAYPANWNRDGRKAGPIRNARMLADSRPTMVLAFPGGNGTADMVRRAKRAGVTVREVQP